MPIIQTNRLNNGIIYDLYWTDEEISYRRKYLKWEETRVNWENIHLTWDEVFIIRNYGGSIGSKEYIDGNPWMTVKSELGEEDAKKLIKVYCRVNGIDYEETRSPIDNIKISINEFERFIKDAINIKIGF